MIQSVKGVLYSVFLTFLLRFFVTCIDSLFYLRNTESVLSFTDIVLSVD